MAAYYADSSVLIKRHIPEAGSEWVRTLTDTASTHLIVTASITQVEGVSAFNRRLRDLTLAPNDYSRMVEDWTTECSTRYKLIALSPQIVFLCRRLLETYPLRAYDAVQLATAGISNQGFVAAGEPPLIFLSADKRLLDAARGEGFAVDDPNQHP